MIQILVSVCGTTNSKMQAEKALSNNLSHVALLQDVGGLLDVRDDPLNDDVRVIDLDGVHDRFVDVNGKLKLKRN